MSVAVDIARLAEKMKRAGVPADYGPDLSRLLVRIWEELAKGKPIGRAYENEIVAEAHRLGYQVAIHAQGDYAITMAVNAIEYAMKNIPELMPATESSMLCAPRRKTCKG